MMARRSKDRIYWDTCIFIDFLNHTNFSFESLWPLEEDAKWGKTFIVTSLITYVEYYKLSYESKPEDIRVIREYLERSHFRKIPVDFPIAFKAQDLCNDVNVGFADSIHLATAIQTDCTYLLTFDGTSKKNKTPLVELDKKFELPNGNKLRIITPDAYWLEFERKRYEDDLKALQQQQNDVKINEMSNMPLLYEQQADLGDNE